MVYAEIKVLSNRVLSTVIMQDQQRSPVVRHGTLNEYTGVGGDLPKMYSKLWVTPIAVSNRILPYCFALLQAWRKQKCTLNSTHWQEIKSLIPVELLATPIISWGRSDNARVHIRVYRSEHANKN